MSSPKSVNLLSRLMILISPPAAPTDPGSPLERKAIEKAIGTELPDDFCEMARVYGSGEFRTDRYDKLLAIENPFSSWFPKSLKQTSRMYQGSWAPYET